jgi:hypothetical protein
LAWDVRDDRLAKIASGMIPYGESDTIAFTPTSDGIYLLGASAGSCAYSLTSANVPVGLYAGEPCKFIHGVKQLYFNVPDGVQEFTLGIEGAGAETVRVNVFDPEGAQVATGQTTTAKEKAVVNVAAGNQTSKIWSLELTRADEGVLEDNSIQLDAKLVPVLSLVPEQVFDFARED